MLAFLLAQASDGALTYVGIATMGPGIEGNPLLASLMRAAGGGAALVGAKLVAASLGIVLHISGVHRIVAALAALYVAAAVVPWTALLFFE
ncbi:MAG: hypothetical protein IMZ67_02680 [Acidobacteria bacterium]|nr:hypothetical protein [Acidobacteriota bacterium]